MNIARFCSLKLVKGLQVGFLACFGGLLVFSGWAGLRAAMDYKATRDAQGQIKGRLAALASAKKVASEKRQLPVRPPMVGMRAIDSFSKGLNRVAHAVGCEVVEFGSAPTTAPYFSVYNEKNPTAGWGMVEVHFNLKGRASDIVETLKKLKTIEVPFELKVVDMARTAEMTKDPGGVLCQAACTLSVLTQMGGAA